MHCFLLPVALYGNIQWFSWAKCQSLIIYNIREESPPWCNQELGRNLLVTIQYFHNYSANTSFMAGVNNPLSGLISVFSPSFVVVAIWHGIWVVSSTDLIPQYFTKLTALHTYLYIFHELFSTHKRFFTLWGHHYPAGRSSYKKSILGKLALTLTIHIIL